MGGVKYCLFLVFGQVTSTLATECSDHIKIDKPQHAHLSFAGNDNLDFAVSWSTKRNSDISTLWYKNKADSHWWYSVPVSLSKELKHGKETLQWIHTAYLRKLEPDSTYEYFCESAYQTSATFQFKTKSLNSLERPLSLVFFGDLGVNGVSIPYLIDHVSQGRYDAVFHIGDFAYNMNDDNGERGNVFMSQIEPIASRVPYMTAVGNHESFDNFTHYKNRFAMPEKNLHDMYYSFNLGPIHFICLATEYYFFQHEYFTSIQIENQYRWLQKDLMEANIRRKEQPWIVVYGHRPMYCSTPGNECYDSRTNPLRTGLEDLLFKEKVDVAIWGHVHNYERSFPIYNLTAEKTASKNLYQDPKGITHIISGVSGCFTWCRESFGDFDVSALKSRRYGFSILKVLNLTTLQFEFFDVYAGKAIDTFIITKKQNVTQQ